MKITICNPTIELDEADVEYTADMALENCQKEAQKGLKALERAHFYLDGNASDEVYEALDAVYRSLTSITWR